MYQNKSLSDKRWTIKKFDERESIMISQRHNIPLIIAKLLTLRDIEDENVINFLNPNFEKNLPNPFDLKDMDKSICKTIEIINEKKKIGIIADYDVDGSTAAAILYNFLKSINCNISIKIPDRFNEGYGPNQRILNEFIEEKVNLVFCLDCGTTAFDVLENEDNKNLDIIIIDHHKSEEKIPNIFSLINPNRLDEKNSLRDLAAVGVTFLFVMGLRKKLRDSNFFQSIKEPNLLLSLDLVALGTICDVVKLVDYNRNFVIKGLEIIKKRHNKGIAKIIDNSNINNQPTSGDLAFFIGPQLNAASRIDNSSLPHKILISNNIEEIESIAKKLYLLNQKRKLIEDNIFSEALNEAEKQINQKFILIYGSNWHNGVLGIIASKLVEKFHKPTFVISFDKKIGTGSARSISKIDIGNIIINARQKQLLIRAGGHKMAGGLSIKKESLNDFNDYLNKTFEEYDKIFFKKISTFDIRISINEINLELLEFIEKLEPFGNGNEEPKFIIKDAEIESYKILKKKHILFFLKNDFGQPIKAISFNSMGTKIGENLIKNKSDKFEFGCKIKKDFFSNNLKPQLIIDDVMIVD